MSKRVKRVKKCVVVEKILVDGRKRQKKIYEEFIIIDGNPANVFSAGFNWTKWRRDHPGRQLTLDDVWQGYG